jgi:hypothetical protein
MCQHDIFDLFVQVNTILDRELRHHEFAVPNVSRYLRMIYG